MGAAPVAYRIDEGKPRVNDVTRRDRPAETSPFPHLVGRGDGLGGGGGGPVGAGRTRLYPPLGAAVPTDNLTRIRGTVELWRVVCPWGTQADTQPPGPEVWRVCPPAGLSSGAVDGELRLSRTPTEAATNVSYFAVLGYRVVVASPLAAAAADASDVEAGHARELTHALAALRR